VVDAEVRAQLLTISSATAERLLRSARAPARSTGTTRRGALLKHQVAVRTFAQWDEARPGFVEADLVAHCGGMIAGAYLHTLVLTDVATAWTECFALRHRTQAAVIIALDRARQLLPFQLRGFDSDNGSEFLNAELIAYCARDGITFTRGRSYHKDDQCFVELCGHPHNSTYADSGIMPTRPASASCYRCGGRHNPVASLILSSRGTMPRKGRSDARGPARAGQRPAGTVHGWGPCRAIQARLRAWDSREPHPSDGPPEPMDGRRGHGPG
jgi:hypothetical protein